MNTKHSKPASDRLLARRTLLAVAISVGFGITGQAFAQSTTGTIFGQAPVAAGESIQVSGGSGVNRTVPVDSAGRYTVTLPVGSYTVSLIQNGKVVQTRENVSPAAAGAVTVNFTEGASVAGAQTLSTVSVSANKLPPIDVTQTNQTTTITAAQLANLPLQRSAAAIALLAPGVTAGASADGKDAFGNSQLAIGGSSIAENAYYINGFATSDPIANQGGVTLPYGAIAQQQTLTSGYGAQYGRSAGGVVSQVGQSGTNDWHFGGQVLWQPAFAGGTPGNYYFGNPANTVAGTGPGTTKGSVYDYRNANSTWNNVYDAYIGGPLIKDKLFFFIAAEADHTADTNVQSVETNNVYYQKTTSPKYYAKLDWNITDNNVLSLTAIQNSYQYQAPIYNYDNATHSATTQQGNDISTKNTYKVYIAKYTSYITDDLSLNALYGKMYGTLYSNIPGAAAIADLPSIIGPPGGAGPIQNPAYTPNGTITNAQTATGVTDPNNHTVVQNYRLDLDWKLGDHDIQFGIDNNTAQDLDDGTINTGPGYSWEYAQSGNPALPTAGTSPNVSGYAGPTAGLPNGAQGYYVARYNFANEASVKVTQQAQYIQDNWQVAPNLLLNLGLRNDQFTNYNPQNQPYLRLTSPQWAPRLGASWDVFGDSSMKIFANAGRYYLAMPAAVALRDAGAPTYELTYYTYSGINPTTGVPTGLTPIPSNPTSNVPLNGENGSALNPTVVAAKNLKAEYQDEFVLGMQQQINSSWDYGVTGLFRKLRRVIDDTGDTGAIYDAMIAQGANPAYLTQGMIDGSILINPGETNTISAINSQGQTVTAKVTNADFGFPKLIRNYYSLEMFLEHQWDGKFYAKIDYVYSKSYGDTEGPVQSNIGQAGKSVSATEEWDYPQLMENSNGLQSNDQKHSLKVYGTYQIAPEWKVSGIATIASGTPKACLGLYGPNQTDPISYGSSYHYCGGIPTPGGSTGFTPWTHILSLQGEYRPLWADKKLGFQVQVYNVFNEQKVTQYNASYGSTASPIPTYLTPLGMETPRYVQVGVTYDW